MIISSESEIMDLSYLWDASKHWIVPGIYIYVDERYLKDDMTSVWMVPVSFFAHSHFDRFNLRRFCFFPRQLRRHQALDKLKVRQQEMCKKVMASVLKEWRKVLNNKPLQVSIEPVQKPWCFCRLVLNSHVFCCASTVFQGRKAETCSQVCRKTEKCMIFCSMDPLHRHVFYIIWLSMKI